VSLRSIEDVRAVDVPAGEADLLAWLGGPALLRIAGRDRSRTRAVGALLHGNEPSGFRAVHALLRRAEPPAVDVVCFVGAVEAARVHPAFTHRALYGHRDLNRCFRAPFEGVEGGVARDAIGALERAHPEALVDMHNNTGHNPAYTIATHGTPAHLALASFFATRFIHTTLRLGSLMEALSPEVPAITVECGRAGTESADAFACDRLARWVELAVLPSVYPPLRVYVDPIRVTLRREATVAFGETPQAGCDLTLRGDVDRHNFVRLEAGTQIGWVARGAPLPLEARGVAGDDVARALFEVCEGTLVASQPFVPVMMTADPVVAAADCLFYVVRENTSA
jgi:hypothetical protein